MGSKKTGKIINCLICKKEFYTPGYLLKNGRKYCSDNCYYLKIRLHPLRYWLGKHRSEKDKKIMSKSHKGQIPWCLGKKLTQEHKEKMRIAKLGKYLGKNHPNWKGGITYDKSKNRFLKYINKEERVYESRFIMEQFLNRKLKPEEVVHHINEDSSDNRIENLMLFPNNSAHIKYHWSIK